MTKPATVAGDLHDAVGDVLIGMDETVDQLTIALLTRGHVLLEGVPGVAKTTLASGFAGALGLSYARIQLTPDVLPADITGTTVYREHAGEFELQKGPIFANVVVADEINRASPKTQSALLEAMAERRVSIEGQTLSLPEPFTVIATQNPIEMEGTFELAEAQRDRFQQKLTVGLPDRETERGILERFDDAPTLGPDDVEQVVSAADVLSAREDVAAIHVSDAVREYVLDLVAATREHPDVVHGASPRATLALVDTAKARAAIDDREYARPDDVKAMLQSVLAHRLVLTTEAELGDVGPADVVEDVSTSVASPGAPSSMEDASGENVAGDGGPEPQ